MQTHIAASPVVVPSIGNGKKSDRQDFQRRSRIEPTAQYPASSANPLKCMNYDLFCNLNEKVLCIFKTNIYSRQVLFIHFTGETT